MPAVAQSGKVSAGSVHRPLTYEGLTFDGKCDVFELIDEYVGVIEEFVEYGIAEGFIS